VPSRALLDRLTDAYGHGSITLHSLYHEEALVYIASDPDNAIARDDLFGRPELPQPTSLIGPVERIPIDERAGLLHAAARVATSDGGYRSTQLVWLITFKDELVYRQRIHATRSEAVADEARNGVGLGLPIVEAGAG
jgi:hypothetical protein